MISEFLGIDPAFVFFILLTTISASLWAGMVMVENNYSDQTMKNIIEFLGTFICTLFLSTFSMIFFVKLFYWSISVL